jgi:hypothetical protein
MPFVKSLLKWILLAAVVLLVAFMATVGIFGHKLGFQTKTIDRSQPALLLSIQELSQYHAAVGNFEVIVDKQEDVPWVPDVIAGKRSLFVAGGTVNAYVDFAGFKAGDLKLSDDGTSVQIRLPEAQLDKPNLDHERTYLFSQDRGIVDRVDDALSTPDQSELYKLAEKKMAAAAEASDLTRQAEANTKAMLTSMFSSLDMKVTFIS